MTGSPLLFFYRELRVAMDPVAMTRVLLERILTGNTVLGDPTRRNSRYSIPVRRAGDVGPSETALDSRSRAPIACSVLGKGITSTDKVGLSGCGYFP